MADCARILILAWGNPGRRDDGLGPAAAAALETLDVPGLVVTYDYQLTVEDAAVVAQCDVVIFVDAAITGPEPFSFQRIMPGEGSSFSTHSVTPSQVLTLAAELFGARPTAWLLGIRGYEFDEFGESLSPAAQKNLAAAVGFLRHMVERGDFDGAAIAKEPALVAAASKGVV